ncbi:xylose isomerase [Halorubrum ezzemoulense]|uniref:Sugar phosphate isomerase/epimerase n=1 Tax=Halorubrum ezzemoulense TaxID=337243 RepID=A0A256KDH3_HALEZ|nr:MULTISPECIES: sugar phosphate isomerase/epimerase [Halorubrum]OYR61168.1 xylose isomerase [Halorubrum ezzemoulense]OYR77587.1 xylose isomerase [Halorubrum ezzemoulense]OYR79205.1 xylose isomerase [Halorubrum ezzemoulense]PHQ41313.1 xylose isomerase [Halorubrum sp. C191]QAY20423.1 sugar phosphate isomerase/epimerase [Halorubrum ezzemoulense]
MDIGVLTVPLGGEPLDDAAAYLDGIGVDAVELGVGGWPGEDHVDREALLDDPAGREELLSLLDDRGLRISALATHNNPLHPSEERAAAADRELREAIELADLLGVDTVTCFSGLPAGAPGDSTPNWVTAPWPTQHADALDYQWDEVAIPYWRDVGAHADHHGVDVAIEMHPNMLVYEPTGLVALREATNDRIGANFDPSHLYWQGIDVTEAIRFLGERDAIHHVHAKDTKVYEAESRVKGVLDTTSYADTADRSWLFRSIGYGHGEEHWKDVVSTLRLVDYEGALSIEHEDALTSSREGLEKAVDVLDRAVFETEPGDAYWAE